VRTALFITCVNDALYPGTGKAVVTLLRRLGCDVEFPAGQTCCGQMHFNSGYRPEAAKLARRFADVFAGFDAVVTPSPSCAGMVRDQYATLGVPASPCTS
jgi:L-lactate dehydrogenase complex protein LldE